MSNIPTAEEFLKQFELGNTGKVDIEDANEALIEFAKLHVEASLKVASKNVIVNNYGYEGGIRVNKNSILNAYPLTNIK